jgi:hypothetical protein
MSVAGHSREFGKLLVTNGPFLSGERLPDPQVVGKDLPPPLSGHFGAAPCAWTTTGKILRVRSFWISTTFAD